MEENRDVHEIEEAESDTRIAHHARGRCRYGAVGTDSRLGYGEDDRRKPADTEVCPDPQHAQLRVLCDAPRRSAYGASMGTAEAGFRLPSSETLAHSERGRADRQRGGHHEDGGRSNTPVRAWRLRIPAESSHAPGELHSRVPALHRRRCRLRHPLRGCERRRGPPRPGTKAVRQNERYEGHEGEEEVICQDPEVPSPPELADLDSPDRPRALTCVTLTNPNRGTPMEAAERGEAHRVGCYSWRCYGGERRGGMRKHDETECG